MKIIHAFPLFRRYGGAQKVIMTLFSFFKGGHLSYISSYQNYQDILDLFKNKFTINEYIKISFWNLLKYRNSIVFSHDRKVTLFLVFAAFFIRFKVIHVAHNVFTNKRLFTVFPTNIIAVSYAVKNNLVDYFKVSPERVQVIYNGIEDFGKDVKITNYAEKEVVRVLFLAQIEPVKQQLKIVDFLKNRLNWNVRIDFAGDGNDADSLQELIQSEGLQDRFNYIGFVENVNELIQDYHYVMLFSKKEGLGLSLIEACMLSTPIITKGVDGCEACAEICIDGYNGFIANDFVQLEHVLNSLNSISEVKYKLLCRNARKVYEGKFSLEAMKNKYEEYLP